MASTSGTEEAYGAVREGFDRIVEMLNGARSVALCGHTSPDGDALGSVLALADALHRRWPQLRVHKLLADDASVPATLSFLPGAGELVPASSFDGDVDLFIAVDTPTRDRLRHACAVLDRARASALIDHHPSRQPYVDVACVVDTAASAGDVVWEFLRRAGIELNPETATCLLCAVMTDTGRFQYQNTDPHAMAVASASIEAGASCHDVAAAVYQNDSLPALKLRARALERLAVDASGRVATSYVTLDDMVVAGACAEDCEGVVDEIRRLGGVDACVFLREQPDGKVRGNLRSKRDELDVASVAQAFGGGGHRAAAGFTYEGTVEEALDEVIAALLDRISHDLYSESGAAL